MSRRAPAVAHLPQEPVGKEFMTTTLWDTTGTAVVVKALAAERRTGGAVTSGNWHSPCVVVVDERDVNAAEEAATVAASKHPMRLLMIIRREIRRPGSPAGRRGAHGRATRPR